MPASNAPPTGAVAAVPGSHAGLAPRRPDRRDDDRVRLPQLELLGWPALLEATRRSASSPREDAAGVRRRRDVADTQVDKGARQVTLENVRIEKVHFPSATNQAAAYQKLLQQNIPPKVLMLELDRLRRRRDAQQEEESAKSNDGKERSPEDRVLDDAGASSVPHRRALEVRTGTAAKMDMPILNTRPPPQGGLSGRHFLRLFDGWMTARALHRPWTAARTARGATASIQESRRR